MFKEINKKLHINTGIERLAAVTGGEIASTFDKPELVKLGTCKRIDEIMIGEDKLIRFSGCAEGQACTIVLRGASSHLLGMNMFASKIVRPKLFSCR